MLGRLIVVLFGVLGAGGLAQGPEIASQYQQRLGGAVSELETVIRQFDADVANNGLTRPAAIDVYQKSPEAFLRDRGRSMEIALKRYDSLKNQIEGFEGASDLYKPVYMIMNADKTVLEGVRKDYTLGLPVTTSGIAYGVIGAFLGAFFGMFLRMLAGSGKAAVPSRSGR
ncbi:MAG: DUF2937 family protein [Rhizobiales bacterium]|nr:DUF2937 family protein [Hyphomicrobiales bacterium]